MRFNLQGNITFKLIDDRLFIENRTALNDTANLFSISAHELSTALTQRVIAAGGEVVQKAHTSTEAEYGRDALAKVIFFHSLCLKRKSIFIK